ncbi:hypothetical protein C9I87_18115 [Photobacterium iliopiscarium]|uniref:hypothetical protein n=1 Tax=Photobacterium iliopiscarium TaxID=56192 RepID=UPI000D16FB1D|nr:hypothetical protein [Photobacterium iliopiscarium]PST87542.1 hypothetical protein C9I87_18115 [Photobacterium iliopiscarium]
MFFSEMIFLSKWLDDKESLFSPIQKLAVLQSILKENIAARNSNYHQVTQIKPFTEEKNLAFDAIKKLSLFELSKDQITCLSVHNADQYMGIDGYNYLESIFKNEVHDLAFLASEVQKIHFALTNAKTAINAVAQSMIPYAKLIEEASYLEDQARFSIIFKEGVQINSLKDLETKSKEWNAIIHGIGVSLGVPPNEFKVLGARNGSLVIDLYMCAAAIVPIGFILNRSLSIIESFAMSMKRLKAIYELEIDDPAIKEINQDIKALSEKYFSHKKLVSAKKIASQILDETECPPEKRPEAESNLESAIKKILNHLRKGGDLDAFVPTEHNPNEEEQLHDQHSQHKANELIQEFRHKKLNLKKEEIIQLLEHFNFEDKANSDESDAA